jgi:hypothetical protein
MALAGQHGHGGQAKESYLQYVLAEWLLINQLANMKYQ